MKTFKEYCLLRESFFRDSNGGEYEINTINDSTLEFKYRTNYVDSGWGDDDTQVPSIDDYKYLKNDWIRLINNHMREEDFKNPQHRRAIRRVVGFEGKSKTIVDNIETVVFNVKVSPEPTSVPTPKW